MEQQSNDLRAPLIALIVALVLIGAAGVQLVVTPLVDVRKQVEQLSTDTEKAGSAVERAESAVDRAEAAVDRAETAVEENRERIEILMEDREP